MAEYPRPQQDHRQPKQATPEIYLYISLLMVLVLSPSNFINTPLQFIYANELKLNAAQTAQYKALINCPGYFAFLFGVCRDRFNPFGIGDRGFILIFATLAAIVIGGLAFVPLTLVTLGVALILWGIATGLIGAAFQAIMRNVSEMRMMSGRMSTTYQFMAAAIGMVFLLAGGWFSDHLKWQHFLYVTAGLYLLMGLFAFYRPAAVYDGLPSGGSRSIHNMMQDFRDLLRYKAFWLAVLIWGLWAFAPAAPTPLFFFLTKQLHMGRTQFALYNALNAGFAVPTTLLFGFLCKRMSLWRLLLISTCIGIPQWLPVMFIHSINQSYVIAAFMASAGGLASAAYYGLLFRACPKNLAGTGMLIASSLVLIITEGGNILGGKIYESWGFTGCALITCGAYVFLLPLCFLLPRSLVEPADGQEVPTEEELVA